MELGILYSRSGGAEAKVTLRRTSSSYSALGSLARVADLPRDLRSMCKLPIMMQSAITSTVDNA